MRRIRHHLIKWLAVSGVLMHAMLPFAHALAMSGSHGIATTLCSLSGSHTIYLDPGDAGPAPSPLLKWPCPLCVAGAVHALPPELLPTLLTGGYRQHALVAALPALAEQRNAAIHFSPRAPPVG